MSFAGETIIVISTNSSHSYLVILCSLLNKVIVLRIKCPWLIHVSCRWMSWLCFLVCCWNLLIGINAIHVLCYNLILTCKRLLLSLLLWCQITTSLSYIRAVLLSVVRFLAVYVTVEGVLLAATNTHLTLTQHMLTILIKTFICVSNLLFLRQCLLLVTKVHSLLFLSFTRLCIWLGKSGLLITYTILKYNILLICNGVLNWFSFLIVAERRSCILPRTTGAYGIVILGIKSSTNTTFVHLISRICLWLLRVCYVLLELRVVLVLDRNLLYALLWALVVVRVYFYILLIVWILLVILIHIVQISSLHWLSTLILRLLSTHNRPRDSSFVFFFHV